VSYYMNRLVKVELLIAVSSTTDINEPFPLTIQDRFRDRTKDSSLIILLVYYWPLLSVQATHSLHCTRSASICSFRITTVKPSATYRFMVFVWLVYEQRIEFGGHHTDISLQHPERY